MESKRELGTVGAGGHFASALGLVELAHDLAGDGVVGLMLDELLHLRLLVGRHVLLVSARTSEHIVG
jgi:hypothetical protein